jgi:hypothetical protein
MTTVISNDVQNPPAYALLTSTNPDKLPAIPTGAAGAAHSAGTPILREDDRARPKLLLHIARQTGGLVPAGLPTLFLCGAPVRLLLCEIAAGEGPDGPGVCPICAALDHAGRLPAQTGDTNIAKRLSWPLLAWSTLQAGPPR